MSGEVHAEAVIRLSAAAFADVMAGEARTTARIAGIMAAKRVSELIPLRAQGLQAPVTITFEPQDNAILIQALAPEGGRMEALTAVSIAALTLYDMAADATAVVDGVRLAGPRAQGEAPRRSSAIARDITVRGEKARPQVLMGEVTAPRAAPDTRREAFRKFMTEKRLRPTTWAKDAGVTTGEIMGFLTGRSRGFSGEVAEKLARAARVQVEDMFR